MRGRGLRRAEIYRRHAAIHRVVLNKTNPIFSRAGGGDHGCRLQPSFVGSQPQTPAIAKNQVKTETLVKDGQTLVLGGIYVVDKSDRQSRLPYLHKIPFLGNLFKSNEYSDSRKELLIFVQPSVVVSPQAAG